MNARPQCIKDNPVEMLCSTETCINSPFICQDHKNCICAKGHSMCKLVLWNGLMEKMQSMKINEQLKQKISMVNENFLRLEKQLQIAHNNFLQKATNLAKTEAMTFSDLLQQGSFLSITQRFINSLFNSKSTKEDTKVMDKKLLQNELKKIEQKFRELLQHYDNIINVKKISWDVTHKAETIEINGNIAKQTKKPDLTSLNTFVLLNTLLNQGKFSWAIKMLGSGMRIGICIKDIIVAKKYGHQGDKMPGNGTYVIGSGGYTYNHKKVYEKNDFTFTTNDIIYVNYDSSTKKLSFQKNKQPNVYSIQIPAPQANQLYYPCVYLYNEGWAAQIIQ